MIEPIADKLERALSTARTPTEQVFIKLRGTFKEALVCTNTRVHPEGWLDDRPNLRYGHVPVPILKRRRGTSKFSPRDRVIRALTGGMQNAPKSFWNSDKSVNAAKAPNCSISGRERAAQFREACAFITQRTAGGVRAGEQAGENGLGVLERLARLRDAGESPLRSFRPRKPKFFHDCKHTHYG